MLFWGYLISVQRITETAWYVVMQNSVCVCVCVCVCVTPGSLTPRWKGKCERQTEATRWDDAFWIRQCKHKDQDELQNELTDNNLSKDNYSHRR